MELAKIDIKKLTPMMQQYANIKKQYQDAIVFFRLGEFYEMFFEDSFLAASILEIAMTKKSAGLEERVPMCGVPAHTVNTYINKLVEKGYKVAICEQLEPPSKKRLVKREVIRVVTPGTLVSMEEKTSNHIMGLQRTIFGFELCTIDLSTGKITMGSYQNSSEVVNLIHSYNVLEVVVNEKIPFLDKLQVMQTVFSEKEDVSSYTHLVKEITPVFKMMIHYLEDTQKQSLMHLQKAVYHEQDKTMKLDYATKKNLELTQTLRTNNKEGSLLGFLDYTKTSMGFRMLKSWIENPLYDLTKILERQAYIKNLTDNYLERDSLVELLKKVYDLERICAKIALSSVNPREVSWLKNSLFSLIEIKEILDDINYPHQIFDFKQLYKLLDNALLEECPVTAKDGMIFKDGYNSNLDEYRNISSNVTTYLLELEQKERQKTNIKNLKIKYNRVFGYFIEISNSNLGLIKEEYGYERKQTLANGERFITTELKEQEELILNAEEKKIKLELELFNQLKEILQLEISKIQSSAAEVARLDVFCAFAIASERHNLVKPEFNESNVIEIIDSKHPVIENIQGIDFVENDLKFTADDCIMIITGPNMSGKSTYMRQMALTSIMAQIGCYVAASTCNIPLFDGIYTRIGASDDITSGQSTFMVEMSEANYAIQNATSNSLIIFDELGRGTSTFDGMSIASSIVSYINQHLQAKTMFSTHYHELTSLADNKGIFNVNADCLEEGDNVVFTHKIVSGAASDSYGIYVAKLAGLDEEIIKNANELLKFYEKEHARSVVKEYVRLPSQVDDILKTVNPHNLTPMEALLLVEELVRKLR